MELIVEFRFLLFCSILCCVQWLSRVWLFVVPWTVAHQAPLSMGILQARILEWVAIQSSRGSSQTRDQTQVSCIAGRFFTIWATREAILVVLNSYRSFTLSFFNSGTQWDPTLCQALGEVLNPAVGRPVPLGAHTQMVGIRVGIDIVSKKKEVSKTISVCDKCSQGNTQVFRCQRATKQRCMYIGSSLGDSEELLLNIMARQKHIHTVLSYNPTVFLKKNIYSFIYLGLP